MKPLLLTLLLCASTYGAETTATNVTGDLTTTVSERSRADGKPDLRIETVYRGKIRTLKTISRRNRQGKLAVISRSYLVHGKLHMTESDDNGDGFFETVSIFDPATSDFEMFTRQPDGSVRPMATDALAALKRRSRAADEALQHLLRETTDKE